MTKEIGHFFYDLPVPGDGEEIPGLDTALTFAEDFYLVMIGTYVSDETQILDEYEVGDWQDDDDDGRTCTVCNAEQGQVCREAFECDAEEVFDGLHYDRGAWTGTPNITDLQVMQFMHKAGIHSNTHAIFDITDAIKILLQAWEK